MTTRTAGEYDLVLGNDSVAVRFKFGWGGGDWDGWVSRRWSERRFFL